MTPTKIWEGALTKDWQMVEMSSIVVGDIVDTGERIRRVTGVTSLGGSVVLQLKEGPPYEAEADNLIDVYRSTTE